MGASLKLTISVGIRPTRGKRLGQAIKVLVIDDHPLFRDALELALIKSKIASNDIQTESNIAEAITALKSDNYALILLDLNLPDSEDFEGFSKIRALDPTIPIIIVSATESPKAYATAISLGAAGYIPKSSTLECISKSIETVLSGQKTFPDDLKTCEVKDGEAAQKLGSLTPAQHRVMSCLSDGLLNKQIAFEMGISEATVKAHMTAIFRKLGANNRTQALLVFRDATRLIA